MTQWAVFAEVAAGTHLVALVCILSSIPMPFLRYGLHVGIQYSMGGITNTLFSVDPVIATFIS